MTARDQLRQELDDAVLTRTGRSIGDLASADVLDMVWPAIVTAVLDDVDVTSLRELLEAGRAAVRQYGFVPEVRCPSCGATWGQFAAYQCDGPDHARHLRVRTVPFAGALLDGLEALLRAAS